MLLSFLFSFFAIFGRKEKFFLFETFLFVFTLNLVSLSGSNVICSTARVSVHVYDEV